MTASASLQRLTARNNINIIGQGQQVMVFAHGMGCDQTMWRLITPAFLAKYKIVLFDHVGSGASNRNAYSSSRYQSLLSYAEDLLELYETLDLRDTIFVGHSVSAMIGVLAANRAPKRFSKLIMLGPSPRYLDDDGYVGGFNREVIDGLLKVMSDDYVAWSKQMATAAMARPDRPELVSELMDSFVNADPLIMRQFAEVTFFSDTREELPKCTTPALIMQCQNDIVVPIAVGEYLQQTLPNSQFALMRATGHYPQLSEPDETIRTIRAFIA
jgi:sigma-B regulation protein RsbQ